MNVLELKDSKTTPDPIHPYPKEVRSGGIPLVIDNGSFQCRVGWASQMEPSLLFKNLTAKTRKERGKKDGELQVGNDITNIEAVRFQLKTQFDRNVVTHLEVQEQILDYIFLHMGIDSQGSVNHPVVITEAYLNPNYSRQLMSELLFECYKVPSISYGVDCLFTFYHGHQSACESGLILNLGHHTTHIIPIIDGCVDSSHSRRINVGGFHITTYLHRLLQLKYPVHFNAITLSRCEEIVHDHSYMAVHYEEELNKWSNPEYYDMNVRRIQLPFIATVTTSSLSADQQRERRKELAKRLVEINARKRDERLAEDEEMLNQLEEVQEYLSSGEEKLFKKSLASFGLANETELLKQISNLKARIQRTRQKIAAANATEDAAAEEPKPKVPKQTTLRPKDGEGTDMWLARIRKERSQLLEKRAVRHQRRQDMAKRRTAAAQERMRIISELARKDKREDNFGMRDEDWDVYKAIRRDGGDTDSEEEQERLVEMEEVLRQHDSTFADTLSSASPGADLSPANPGEAHQLHVGIERVRATEIFFQPSMIGIEEAGLAETIDFILKQYSPDIRRKLVSNVLVTGGSAAIPGLTERLKRELQEMCPFNSSFTVTVIQDPLLSSWKAARDFAAQPFSEIRQHFVTRQEYMEKGGEYLKEHKASNLYCPSPATLGPAQAINNEDPEIDMES